MNKRFRIDRSLKKTVLARIFEHGYSADKYSCQERYCGYFGRIPLQTTFYPSAVCIDRLTKLTEATSTKINNEILCSLLQKEDFDIQKTDTADFTENSYIEIETTPRQLGIIFYNKENK